MLNNSASTTTFGGSAYAWPTSGQSSNYVLTTNGTSTLSWNDPNVLAASTIFWNQTNGLLFPKNSTVDVTIGGQATSSAKFAFLNVAAGTPTASVSAGAAGATYITAGGVIATTAKQSLTLGDSNTGNIQFYSASNSLTSAGNLTLAGTISLPNTNTLTGVSSYVNVNNGIGFGSTTGAPTYYINNLGTGNLNALTLAGNLTLNGNVASHLIPSATTTYDLGSTTRYWQNAYLQNLYVSGNYSGFWQRFNGALSPTNITDDLLVGGTATPSASTTNYFQVLGTGSTQGDATTSGVLTLGTNRTTATIATQRMIPLTIGSSTTGPIQLSPKGTTGLFVDATGQVGVGTTSPGASLDVAGNLLINNGGTIDTRSAGTFTLGGTTQTGLTVGRTGTTTSLTGSNVTAGGIGYGAGNILTFTTAGSSGQALLSGAAGAPHLGDAGHDLRRYRTELVCSGPGERPLLLRHRRHDDAGPRHERLRPLHPGSRSQPCLDRFLRRRYQLLVPGQWQPVPRQRHRGPPGGRHSHNQCEICLPQRGLRHPTASVSAGAAGATYMTAGGVIASTAKQSSHSGTPTPATSTFTRQAMC